MKNLSFRMQLFLACLLLISIPISLLGIFTANRTAKQVAKEHEQSFHTMTKQIDLNIESILSDVEKIGSLHLLNDDIRRALLTNYNYNDLLLIKDTAMMQTQISQANRLNTNVLFALYKTKYNYYFDYNLSNRRNFKNAQDTMEKLAEKAKYSERNSYFGDIIYPDFTGAPYHNLLPMVRILYDANTHNEIGLFYAGINFDAIIDIVEPATEFHSNIFFINQDESLLFPSKTKRENIPDALLQELCSQSKQVNREHPSLVATMEFDEVEYSVHMLQNRITGWKIIHYMDNRIIQKAQYQNLKNYLLIFVISLFLSLAFAFLLSHGLTKSLISLSDTINKKDVENLTPIAIKQGMHNRELQQVVDSYNTLTERLQRSLNQNFQNQINEKQLKLQMLQMQINPHFLYNTLNLISSLANIHDVEEIKIIANSISDILRYNLRSGPIVRLQDEIHQIKQYISIQNIRFPNKFTFECYIPQKLLPVAVPAFILQPLVENSILHGLESKETDAYIGIQAYADTSLLHLFVIDKGIGIAPNKLAELEAKMKAVSSTTKQRENIGLLNVHQRIVANYGEDFGLTIESLEGFGTVVEIRLPFTESTVEQQFPPPLNPQ